jgi:hypothetical protein
MEPLNQLRQPRAFRVLPLHGPVRHGGRQADAEHTGVDATSEQVLSPATVPQHGEAHYMVCEETADGPDFMVGCHRHKWESDRLVEALGVCPRCDIERLMAQGRERYAARFGARQGR